MRFLFDYFPIICFFIAYKPWGIYTTTAVAMIASILQVGTYWLGFRRFEKFHVIYPNFHFIIRNLYSHFPQSHFYQMETHHCLLDIRGGFTR